jgi:hypothetical protein
MHVGKKPILQKLKIYCLPNIYHSPLNPIEIPKYLGKHFILYRLCNGFLSQSKMYVLVPIKITKILDRNEIENQ